MRLRIVWTLLLLIFVSALLAFNPVGQPIYWFGSLGQSRSRGALGYCGGANPPCTNASGEPVSPMPVTLPANGDSNGYPWNGTSLITYTPQAWTSPRLESSGPSRLNQMAFLGHRLYGTADYGWDGASYSALKKGSGTCTGEAGVEDSYFSDMMGSTQAGCPMDDPAVNMGIAGVAAIVASNPSLYSALFVPGLYWNQGEANVATPSTTVVTDLQQLQSDFQISANAAVPQSGLVPTFMMVKSNWPAVAPTRAHPTVDGTFGGTLSGPMGQVEACLQGFSNGTLVCINPEYPYPVTADGIHTNQPGYVRMGLEEGFVMDWVTRRGRPWYPFHPDGVTVTSTFMDVHYPVNESALVLDTSIVSAIANEGFVLTDTDSTGITISSVAVKAGTSDTIRITLSGAPASDKNFGLSYAFVAPNGACPSSCSTNGDQYSGPTNGPRGTVSYVKGTSWNGGTVTFHGLPFKLTGIRGNNPYSRVLAAPTNLNTIPGVVPESQGRIVGVGVVGSSSFK